MDRMLTGEVSARHRFKYRAVIIFDHRTLPMMSCKSLFASQQLTNGYSWLT